MAEAAAPNAGLYVIEAGLMSGGGGRLGYLDWARGLAVLVMIHTHSFFAWVAPEHRGTRLFGLTRLAAGYPGALFLFLAGLAVALVGESARRRGDTGRAIVRRGVLRGIEVLGYAFLFRLWMFTTSGFAEVRDLVRVDVLNCIAVSLALVGAVVLGWPRPGQRAAAALALAVLVEIATPLAWDAGWAGVLPEGLRGYASGRVPGGQFPVFPWAAFAAFGAAAGIGLTQARARGHERAFVAAMGIAGALAYPLGRSFDGIVPSLYASAVPHDFWYTSPAYQLMKVGIVLVIVALGFAWNLLPGPSPLRQMGRTSLLIYWVHIEIVYGMWITPGARERLDLPQAVAGVALLVAAMLLLSIAREGGRPWRMGGALAARA